MPVLSWEQIAAVARQAGWPADLAPVAVAITMPESSRDSDAVQQGVKYAEQGWGLWQITPGDSEPQFGINQAMLNPLNNARAALAKYQSQGGFLPWTTYTSGKYLPYLPAAEAAVAAVYKLNPAALAKAVATATSAAPAVTGGGGAASDWSVLVSYAAAVTTARAAAYTAHAAALGALHGPFKPPAVTPAAPEDVLPRPERI